jgi:hypothetical protein
MLEGEAKFRLGNFFDGYSSFRASQLPSLLAMLIR